MTELINATPHDVTIINRGKRRVIKASGKVIRLYTQIIPDAPISGIPTSRRMSSAEGLPDKREGIFYIVSRIVKSMYPNREDLLVPAEVVRDKSGNIIGCRSLGR